MAQHVIGLDEAREMAHALAYDLAKRTYKLEMARAVSSDPFGAAAVAHSGGPEMSTAAEQERVA